MNCQIREKHKCQWVLSSHQCSRSRTFIASPKSASIKWIMGAVRMDLENLARCPESTPAGLLLKSRLLAQEETQARGGRSSKM